MKKKVIYILLFVLYLLVSCTFISQKIEKEMRTQVIVSENNVERNAGKNLEVPIYFLKADESGETHLLNVGEGTGWVTGQVVKEVDPDMYGFREDILSSEMVINVSGSVAWKFIIYASRPAQAGEGVEIVEKNKRNDVEEYLIFYPGAVPSFEVLPANMRVLEQTEHTVWLEVKDAYAPFIEERVKSQLESVQADGWEIYSLLDIENFRKSVKLSVVVGILFLIPIVLWIICGFWLKDVYKNRKKLCVAVVLGVVTFGVMLLVLPQIDFPSSLMPPENVFDFAYYKAEWEQIRECFGHRL